MATDARAPLPLLRAAQADAEAPKAEADSTAAPADDAVVAKLRELLKDANLDVRRRRRQRGAGVWALHVGVGVGGKGGARAASRAPRAASLTAPVPPVARVYARPVPCRR